MSKQKQALIHSVISIVLCFSMLIGTTFAWFTDTVSTATNIIASGNLKVSMEYKDSLEDAAWKDASQGAIFGYEHWEPGYTDVNYIRINNDGSLALKYQLHVLPTEATPAGEANLADVIDVYFGYVDDAFTAPADFSQVMPGMTKVGTLSDLISVPTGIQSGILLPENGADKVELPAGVTADKGSVTVCIMLHMQESAGNEYQNLTVGGSFSLQLNATQYTYELDSFGNDYDGEATLPEYSTIGGSVSAPVAVKDGVTTRAVALVSENIKATIPEGVKVDENALDENGKITLTLTVAEKDSTDSDVTLKDNESLLALDVHVDGVAESNTVPMIIDLGVVMPTGLNMGNLALYHVEGENTVAMTRVSTEAEVKAHNDFYYDPADGRVVVAMATFSEVALVADTENAWNGTVTTDWYNDTDTTLYVANADALAGLGQLVAGGNNFSGKTVKLLNDINMGGDSVLDENGKLKFYPIGYTSEGYKGAFSGVFDGTGHTISNIYQNTWMLLGTYDGTYYNAAMGLFGYVNGGTVKNLTVDNFSSDGEFTPTGVIAAYAAGDATFENIAITNCNPRVYNTGNGGIIGIAGDTSAADDDHITLSNITVDNSNIISALWGSWDVACGGLVGMYRGNVDGSGNATGDTISFTNCHVAAQIDVYNDVCANYQYYAYRYAGMIIGSVRHNTTNADGKTIPNMTGISASGCTVNYGDWNDYYYCEFEKNTMASYSEDYQFSRVPHSELNFTDSNGNGVVDADERASVTGCKHTHIANEDKQAVYLPFHQLFTGYSWGVNSVGLEAYSGIVTDLDIKEDDQNTSELKFDCAFPDTTVNDETGIVQTNFLYRVGNLNAVNVGSLFAAAPKLDENGEKQYDEDGNLICWDINDKGTYVRIDKLYDDADVTCEFTANTTDWTQGTLKFEGTGVVDIVIQDYDYCTPTVLHLEVVDAMNATTATSATANNVVLLNDCGFSSIEVSNGYSLYGNGFTMTCASDSAALSFDQFVALDSGTLDNVQIVCPNYDYAALYNSQLKDTENNRYETTNGTTRYYNAKSAVLATGNSQILNSRISGGRAALYASSGNIVVDNSRLEGGAVATTIISGANSFVFRDATLIQKPTVSTYDTSKTLMGMSVLYLCDEDGNATPTTLEGSFVQNAWADSSCTSYMPTGTSTIADTVLSMDGYMHTVNNKTCVNLGFAYMPSDGTTVAQPNNITDQRTDKETVPYSYANVIASVPVSGINVNISTYVYTYGNGSGTNEDFTGDSEYTPDEYSDIITLTYSDDTDGLVFAKSYGTEGWVYELNVDLDKASGYALDFSKVTMSVNGISVNDFMVDGVSKPSTAIAVSAGGVSYTLSATVNDKEYSAVLKVTGVETSKDAPSIVASDYGTCLLVGEKGTSTTWSAAAPALEGIQIKYWSVAEKQYKTITLSNYTPTTAGQQNETNTSWTYTEADGDFTLTITNTAAVHSGNSIYAMPVVCDKKLYFVITSSSGLVSTSSGSRNVTLKYEFADNNGGKLDFTNTFTASYDSSATLYDYSKFCEGTLEEASNGCVTEGTLITMADGTQKLVERLNIGDMVLAFNHETGEFVATPVIFNTHVDDLEAREYDVLHLEFSNGEELEIVESHGLFDMTLMKYVYLDYENYTDFIGHKFFYAGSDGTSSEHITLEKGYIGTKVTRIFCPVTYFNMNSIANGFLNAPNSPYGIAGPVNYFDYDPDLKYNEEAMQRDIEKYGLYTYDDFREYISEEAYNSSTAVYLKVAEGKGLITFEEILIVINYLLEGALIN